MLILKFYSPCLFNEFLKKKFINLHLSMYTDPGVFSCIIWKKNESDGRETQTGILLKKKMKEKEKTACRLWK